VIRPLVLLELRRQRALVVRMLSLTVLVGVVFFAAGKRTPESLLAALIGCSLGVVLIVPMGVSRDKMEGTLDFICGLPVKSRDIASSRFIAVALLAIPWALGIGALSIAVPAPVTLNPVVIAWLAWLAMLLLGAGATALFATFDLESLLGAPVIAMILALVIVPRLVRALFPALTPATVMQWITKPASSLMLASALVLISLAVGTIAFAITARGFANHRATPGGQNV
jgi:hypothetical protein